MLDYLDDVGTVISALAVIVRPTPRDSVCRLIDKTTSGTLAAQTARGCLQRTDRSPGTGKQGPQYFPLPGLGSGQWLKTGGINGTQRHILRSAR